MKNRQYITIGLFAVTALFIASCSGGEEKTIIEEAPAVSVTLGGINAIDSIANQFITASGKITAKNTANVSTRMMGYITKLNARVGQNVRTGQLLVSINSSDLDAKKAQAQAQISQAQAAYNSAEKDYNRFKKLFDQQSATQKELDDMTARYEMAKAGLSAARQMKNEVVAQFKYANVTAPISGVITQKMVEQGDMATPGMPMLVIEAPSQLQATVMVPESQIAQIKNGMPVDILVKSTEQKLTGKVTEISPSASQTGGQYIVKTTVNKGDAKIMSGMYVNVQFPVEVAEMVQNESQTVIIPKSALVEQGQLTGVYTVSSENTAVLRWIRTGKDYGSQVEVLSGLNANEKYIANAKGKLYNGVPVKY